MTVCLCPHRQMGDGLIQALLVLWVLNRDGKVNWSSLSSLSMLCIWKERKVSAGFLGLEEKGKVNKFVSPAFGCSTKSRHDDK